MNLSVLLILSLLSIGVTVYAIDQLLTFIHGDSLARCISRLIREFPMKK
jgi:hypothetical protein